MSTTVGEQIWEEIKNKPVSMFALPSKPVSDYVKMMPIEPSRCYIIHTISSFLPALEEALGPNYVCELMDKYIAVSRKSVLGA